MPNRGQQPRTWTTFLAGSCCWQAFKAYQFPFAASFKITMSEDMLCHHLLQPSILPLQGLQLLRHFRLHAIACLRPAVISLQGDLKLLVGLGHPLAKLHVRSTQLGTDLVNGMSLLVRTNQPRTRRTAGTRTSRFPEPSGLTHGFAFSRSLTSAGIVRQDPSSQPRG